jgi:hypothetical protein
MNDQDRDLIAALAQGQLSKPAAEDAIARIETDSELASEYVDQVTALQFLQSASPPVMTPAERSTLHANLTEQLDLLPAAPPTPSSSKKRVQWWVPVFGFATAAAVVAAFVIFPGSSQDTFQEVSADLESGAESSSKFSTASPQTTNASQDAQDSATVEESTVTEESAGAEEPPVADDGSLSVYETESVGLDELLAKADGAESRDSVQRQISTFGFGSIIDLDSGQVDRCLSQLESEIPADVVDIHVIGAEYDEESTVIHLGFDYGSGVEDGLSFVLENCSDVVHSDQG